MSHTRVINLLKVFAGEAEDLANAMDRQVGRNSISLDVATKTAADMRHIAQEYRDAAEALTTDDSKP